MVAEKTARPALFKGRYPRVIGHRGSAGTAPENTLPSFRQAVADGADMLELDVRLTMDGHVIVMHDDRVDRTTNGAGKVDNFSLEQLQKLDAGFRFSTRRTFPFRGKGVKVPTLEQVLREFPGMLFSVEIKENNDALIDATLAILTKCGRIADGTVVCASFEQKVVRKLRKRAIGLPTSFSIREVTGMLFRSRFPILRKRSSSNERIFQVQWKRGGFEVVTARLVRALHRRGYEVHVWTVNDPRVMQRLLDAGVDGIFTDYPGRLRALLNETNSAHAK